MVIYYNSMSSLNSILSYILLLDSKLFIITIISINIVIFEYRCAPIISKNKTNNINIT